MVRLGERDSSMESCTQNWDLTLFGLKEIQCPSKHTQIILAYQESTIGCLSRHLRRVACNSS